MIHTLIPRRAARTRVGLVVASVLAAAAVALVGSVGAPPAAAVLPTSLTQTPAQASTPATTAEIFTDTASGGPGVLGNAAVRIVLHEALPSTDPVPVLRVSRPDGVVLSGTTTVDTVGASTTTYAVAAATVTDNSGSVSFGASSDSVGTVTVTSSVGLDDSVTATSSLTITPAGNSLSTPTSFTLTPSTQTVRPGSTVNARATVLDQSGGGMPGQVISYTVLGRNEATGTVVTGLDGVATITYPDTGLLPVGDTISANDTSAGELGSRAAQVTYSSSPSPSPSPIAAVHLSASLTKGARVGARNDYATARLTDALGDPIPNADLRFTITGSTRTGATARTNDSGTARVRFVPQHAGRISLSVSFPSDRQVAAAKASGTTYRATLRTTLRQRSSSRHHVRQYAALNISKAGVRISFFQVSSNGHRRYLGSARTNAAGRAARTAYVHKSGSILRAVARPSGVSRDYVAPYSRVSAQRVKR